MCSKTWVDVDNTWFYKQMPKTLCDNEIYCLHRMARHDYAPVAERVEPDVIRTRYIEPQAVTSYKEFMFHLAMILHLLKKEGIRHGNLDMYSVIPHGNRPYLIGWSGSRVDCDPRPDKLPEGDEHWLTQTMEWYALGNMI